MSRGWVGVTPKRISELNDTQFEDLCYDLIVFEARDRGIVQHPEGPPGKSTRDGGRDILLTVQKQSAEPAIKYCQEHSVPTFIGDDVGKIAYSCKTSSGKRSTWFDLVIRDIVKRGAPRPVEALLSGGRFKILISDLAPYDGPRMLDKKTAKPIAHIVDALWERMKQIEPTAKRPVEDVEVEILGPHLIADYLRGRQPSKGGLAGWLDTFELTLPLRGLEEWGRLHDEERTAPRFAKDPQRESIAADIRNFIGEAAATPRARVAWLVGPPGVGKTRLVLEALAAPTETQRVHVALSYEEFREALDDQRLLVKSPDALIVVDDCSPERASDCINRFAAAAQDPAARLIVITPAATRALPQAQIGRRWELPALTEEAILTIITTITGGTIGPDAPQQIASLSEGYPWFATLLAHEALLQQTAPVSLRQATQWALASSSKLDGSTLQALYLRRARCLLAVILTESLDWDELPDEHRDSLLSAVGLDRWPDLVETAVECETRGVLRRVGGWQYKYVTPAVLARVILEWLLGDDGPDPGGKNLLRYGAVYAGALSEALTRFRVSPLVTQSVARLTLEDMITAREDESVLRMASSLGARLEFVAREMPRETARVLLRRIEAHSLDELRSQDGDRRGLVEVLDTMVHRRGAFQDAEAGLFRLAQAENEGYSNNATGQWSTLFVPELNQAYVTLGERVALLKRRMTATEGTAREVALAGARRMLSSDGYTFRVEPLDGPWPAVERSAALAARVEIWRELLVMCSDPRTSLAERARHVVHEELRSAVRMGLGADVLSAVADAIDAWDIDQRVHLVEAVEAIRTYESQRMDKEDRAALERLSSRLVPGSYGERLRQLVGRWGHAWLREGPVVFDRPDRELAREGLVGDRPIFSELDWLTSDTAVRGHLFAEALGHEDAEGRLLSRLLVLGSQWHGQPRRRNLLARYVGGAARAGHTSLVKHAFHEVMALQDMSLLALVVLEVGVTDERLGWLMPATKAATLDTTSVHELGRWPQTFDAVSADLFLSWIDALIAGPPDYVASALDAMWWRIGRRADEADKLSSHLLVAVDELLHMEPEHVDAHHWEMAAKFLVAHGHARRIAEIAVNALTRATPHVLDRSVWSALNAVFERESLIAWEVVAAALVEGELGTSLLLSTLDIHRAPRHWRADVVLAWVDDDPWRGWAIASVMRPHAAKLHPIVRGLLQRFGAEGRVADELASRVHSPGRAVASLAKHDEQQLEHARAWANDPDPQVRNFAERLIRSLKASHERYAAYEEHERRRWGT